MVPMEPKSARMIALRRWVDCLLQTTLNLNRQVGTAAPLRVVQRKDWQQPFPTAGVGGIVFFQGKLVGQGEQLPHTSSAEKLGDETPLSLAQELEHPLPMKHWLRWP